MTGWTSVSISADSLGYIADGFAVLKELQALPQDLSVFSPPLIPPENFDLFNDNLLGILKAQGSALARHTVLQAAVLLPPQAVWSAVALKWTQEDHAVGRDGIVKYCIKALSDGTFDADEWLRLLADEYTQDTLKEILMLWSENNFEVTYASPILRIPIAVLLIESLLESPYDPSAAPASSTVMARIASSSFVDILLCSLALDTGNRLFSINLRLLLAFLPYAPLALTPKVPMMAIVLGRAISWRDRPFVDADSAGRDGFTRTPEPALDWSVATSSMELKVEMPENLQPRRIAQLYIVAFYGAWPSNVIAFVRDPVSYIRGKNVLPIYAVDWDNVWQPGVLATRMEPLIRDFRLHPSLVVFTSTAELADDKRWEKVDAAEFIARSQALANPDQQGSPRVSLLDEDDHAVINGDSSGDLLEKENELLRLEAKFTNRVRKQTSLRLNNDEAEIHSFANQIADLSAQLSQARTEGTQNQSKHMIWQTQLRNKVAMFREEKASWQSEAARIRAELSEAHATAKAQREELAEVKNE
ncbi:uncharacterized protein IL334_004126 [Kwoniella shivajii]|uniref:Uncharacterized protein n=1 Tax=Kwoniella shivajii TaxID=564305 RepID=A0ABZ1D180_9TREE|nr:hypothetical protein IL334_004126 [Kwoniella shivajii]